MLSVNSLKLTTQLISSALSASGKSPLFKHDKALGGVLIVTDSHLVCYFHITEHLTITSIWDSCGSGVRTNEIS